MIETVQSETTRKGVIRTVLFETNRNYIIGNDVIGHETHRIETVQLWHIFEYIYVYIRIW